jgi:alkanesulfonate monooxygenase SsuD/methylene tetrahydromethanopterin reductase-like flavin-dependent oxidoreductase (luciferase family)
VTAADAGVKCTDDDLPFAIAQFVQASVSEETTMPQQLPAVSLVAVPGRRGATLDVAREIEARGFPAIFAPSVFSNMSLCEALAHVTKRIVFATSIAPIYARTLGDFAQSAAFMHEVSGGRFRLGIGVSHAPAHMRMGVTPGKPLGDIRSFVQHFRAQQGIGALPPIIIATLRKQMVALAGEIGDGMVFANGARSHMRNSLAVLPADKRGNPGFFIGNMIPTCICDDIEMAKAVNRKTLTHYALLPNYRNYWKEAGYVEEMQAIDRAIQEKRFADVPKYLTDAWLADCTLFGPAKRVREDLQGWYAAGIGTPILVPSSAAGNQMKAIEEMFTAFAG